MNKLCGLHTLILKSAIRGKLYAVRGKVELLNGWIVSTRKQPILTGKPFNN